MTLEICPTFVKNNPSLILDGDGCIINFTAGYSQYLLLEHGLSPSKPVPDCFDFSDMYPDTPKPYRYIPDFIQSHDALFNTPAYPDAIEQISALKLAGVELHLVTSIGKFDVTVSARTQAILRDFNNAFSTISFLNPGESKLEKLQTMRASLFVDDLEKECLSAMESGHTPFIFDREYNQSSNKNIKITRIRSLIDLPYFK
jgi:FMN phosphatase YigB (HAD superfamily)